MPRRARELLLGPVALEREADTPLHRQVYGALRNAILSGALPRGAELPGTRALAQSLGVSRSTTLLAFEQLFAEGYLQSKPGGGTFVAGTLPEEPLHTGQQVARKPLPLPASPPSATPGEVRAFAVGLPALDHFPKHMWARLAARSWRRLPPAMLGNPDPAGHLPLREAIAARMRETRAILCEPAQIVIVSGVRQALELCVQTLGTRGGSVWMENPGYAAARDVFVRAGLRTTPVPVDDAGLIVDEAIARDAHARMAYVTPSHQYPLGVTLALPRRLQLLDWARRHSAWVLEDDYDNEFRYEGRPLAALASLDPARVIYIGTFSKTLAPTLRLGFVIAPPALASAFVTARAQADRQSSMVDQMVLAAFLQEGHFARHVRAMRALYAERQRVLLDAVTRAGLPLEIRPTPTGLQVLGLLPPRMSDTLQAEKLQRAGVTVQPLSAHSAAPLARGGLLLGYAPFDARQIRTGVAAMARVMA